MLIGRSCMILKNLQAEPSSSFSVRKCCLEHPASPPLLSSPVLLLLSSLVLGIEVYVVIHGAFHAMYFALAGAPGEKHIFGVLFWVYRSIRDLRPHLGLMPELLNTLPRTAQASPQVSAQFKVSRVGSPIAGWPSRDSGFAWCMLPACRHTWFVFVASSRVLDSPPGGAADQSAARL